MQLSKDLKGSIMIAFTMSGEWTKPKEAWERALENIALEFKKLRNEDVKNKRNKLEITQDRMADFLGITR
jgi:DNA-binding transcriptional regulator YiaG